MIFRHDRTLELVPASVRDYRELARRRLPRQLFDYIDGGAYEEHTLAANSADLGVLGLRQRVLRDVSDRRLARVDSSGSGFKHRGDRGKALSSRHWGHSGFSSAR